MLDKVTISGNSVMKEFTCAGDLEAFALFLMNDMAYSGRARRYANEANRLIAYEKAGLRTPPYVSGDPAGLAVLMGRLPGRNFWQELRDRNLSEDEALRYLEKSAELLRQIHNVSGIHNVGGIGEHGDPWLNNFLVGPDGVYVFDFAHSKRGGTPAERQNKELGALYVSAIQAVPSAKDEIRKAVSSGYGREPEELWTPHARAGKAADSLVHKVISRR